MIKLLLIINIRVTIKFPFKKPFPKMKSNFKNIFSKTKISEISKISLKKTLTHLNTLSVHFHSPPHKNKNKL